MLETDKMVPDIKDKWVAALRSSEYQQTSDFLKNDNKHCCLGVLCDLYAKEAGIADWNQETLGDGDSTALPGFLVIAWSGLNVDKRVEINGSNTTLFVHNDFGVNFNAIADAIEKNF